MASYSDTAEQGPVTYRAGADPGGTADQRWSSAVRTSVETGLAPADLKTKADALVGAALTENAALVCRFVEARWFCGGVGVLVAHYECKDSASTDGTQWSVRCHWRVVDWPWTALGTEGANLDGLSLAFTTEKAWRRYPAPFGIPQATILKRYRATDPDTDLDMANVWHTLGGDLEAGVFGSFAAANTVYLGVTDASEYYSGAATNAEMVKAWKWDYKGFAVPIITQSIPLICAVRTQIG